MLFIGRRDQAALDHWWPTTGVHRPEDSLVGESYRHGGGWWDGPRANPGYAVQEPEHWAFAGTGLQTREHFGANSCPPLAGYECDGAPLASGCLPSGALGAPYQ